MSQSSPFGDNCRTGNKGKQGCQSSSLSVAKLVCISCQLSFFVVLTENFLGITGRGYYRLDTLIVTTQLWLLLGGETCQY